MAADSRVLRDGSNGCRAACKSSRPVPASALTLTMAAGRLGLGLPSGLSSYRKTRLALALQLMMATSCDQAQCTKASTMRGTLNACNTQCSALHPPVFCEPSSALLKQSPLVAELHPVGPSCSRLLHAAVHNTLGYTCAAPLALPSNLSLGHLHPNHLACYTLMHSDNIDHVIHPNNKSPT